MFGKQFPNEDDKNEAEPKKQRPIEYIAYRYPIDCSDESQIAS